MAINIWSAIDEKLVSIENITVSPIKGWQRVIWTSSFSKNLNTIQRWEKLMVKTNHKPFTSENSTTAIKNSIGLGTFSITLVCTKESNPTSATSVWSSSRKRKSEKTLEDPSYSEYRPKKEIQVRVLWKQLYWKI